MLCDTQQNVKEFGWLWNNSHCRFGHR